ncbi:MAG TPA: hypothetical protein EYH38_03480 [Leucothrix sp.]|nr:hypothetical protein [Leucothrix sp.]
MDSIFLLTVSFIFLGALFSNIMKWRNRDRVLKDLQGFHSTIEMIGGKKIWGRTHIYTNGMELYFSRETKNSQGESVNSYIFYHEDIDQIRAIYRNHSELSKENQAYREKEIKAVSNPSLLLMLNRKLRIFFNMFNDAIGEALNVFLSRMKGGKVGGGMLLSTQSDYLKKMGTTALTAVGNTHDPILERYINHRVVVKLEDELDKDEFCGFLKEYSSGWLSILDCRIKHTHCIELDDIERLTLQRDMDFSYFLYEKNEGELALDILLAYFGSEPLKLIAVKDNNPENKYRHRINQTLKHGQSISFTLNKLPQDSFKNINPEILPLEFEMIAEERREDDIPEENEIYQSVLPDFELVLSSTHIRDVYLPRALATLRHSAE